MANVDAPFGLRPVKHVGGAPYNGAGNVYFVNAAQVIAPGDPVLITGDADTNGIPRVARATAGSRITGVMLGKTNGAGTLLQDSTQTTTASVDQYLLVCDDPTVIYEAQSDGDLDAGDIGSNTDLVTANAVNDRSAWELNSATHDVTATLTVRVLRLVPDDRNALGANAVAEVLINTHTMSQGVGSLGI